MFYKKNNNNNNNLNSYDNIFVSMNENMAAAAMNMMFPGRWENDFSCWNS